MGSHADSDPTHAVDGLVRAIRDLTSDPNYKLVADVFSEFLFLKDHNHRLSMSHRETMEEYRKFRNELEAGKDKLEKEKKELEGTIHDKIQEILQLTAVKASLEGDLHDTRVSLDQEKKGAAEAAETAAKKFADAEEAAAKELAELQTSKETELAALQKKDGEIADLIAKYDGEIAALEAAKAAVEDAKREAEEAAAAAAEVAAQEIAALTEAKTGLEEVKAANEAEIATHKDTIASLEEAKAGLEEVKTNHEAEIGKLHEDVANLEEAKKTVEESLAAANAEIESLRSTVAQKETDIEALQESVRIAEEQIASLQQTVEDKNGEIENLHAKLTAEGERADSAIAHGNDLQSKLDETEQTLQHTSTKLADLEQYRVVLQDDNEDVYVTVLDKIWTNIVTLVEATFRPDIDESILADPSCWTNLRSSPYLKHATSLQIPLPQSNSPAAKGMRISAVLAVLSRALHRHLFRPVYLLDADADDEPLVRLLRLLEDDDPQREAHMRATLLSMMPDRQMAQGARRVKTVVREVSWLVQHLLGALQFEAFCVGLEAACRLACEQWMRIQLAALKIEPYFGPPYDDFDWQVLELPEFTEAAMREDENSVMNGLRLPSSRSDDGEDLAVMDGPLETVEAGSSSPPPRNGTPAAADGEKAGHANGDTTPTPDHNDGGGASIQEEDDDYAHQHDMAIDDEGEIEPEEILLVVWPSMCSVEGGDLVSITQGLVISKEQARPALEEVRARSRMIARPGSRRARTLSMPAHSRGGSPTRVNGKGGAFLQNGAMQSPPLGGAASAGEEKLGGEVAPVDG
ncbi:hypothetical protein QBC47DRAFT_436217 [Echria macrotheca]|uniref:Mei5 protein n=1 Tax=Echria macrotheca TaxID=438768 RepID=A0AAJ0BIH8_9PEZI|nr:hypothetical protein QBC47DRAFT_436217 [Echria macrotheca]